MILCDIHTHSDNSFDAKSSVDAMCESAVKRGLSVLAVTDHCEAEYIRCGEDCEFGSFDRQIPKSIADIRAAQKKYEGKLDEPIKSCGSYQIRAKLGYEIYGTVNVLVVEG